MILDSESDHPIHVRFATDEKKLGPEQRFAVEVPRAIAFGQIDGKPGIEILVLEGQSGRARVLTLDQSADRRRRTSAAGWRSSPCRRGTERGRSLAVGDLDGDGSKDVVVTDPANAQVWVYLQTGRSGLGAGQTFPSLGQARTVRLADRDGDGKDEVYVLSEQEKQIGRSTFENGRLTFPTPLPIDRRAGRDGRGRPRWRQDARDPLCRSHEPARPSRRRRLRAAGPDREKSGHLRPHEVGRASNRSRLPGVTAVPAAIKTLDVNQDGQADLLIFKEYGPPLLLLGQKEGRPGRSPAAWARLDRARPPA